MDKLLSIIPELFYDGIARFVPGCAFWLGVILIVPDSRGWLSHRLMPNPRVVAGPTEVVMFLGSAAVLVGLLVTAWVTGLFFSRISSAALPIYLLNWSKDEHCLDVLKMTPRSFWRKLSAWTPRPFRAILPCEENLILPYQTACKVRSRLRIVCPEVCRDKKPKDCLECMRTLTDGECDAFLIALKTAAETTCLRNIALGCLGLFGIAIYVGISDGWSVVWVWPLLGTAVAVISLIYYEPLMIRRMFHALVRLSIQPVNSV